MYFHKWRVCYYDWFANEIWQKEKELIIPVHKFEADSLSTVRDKIYSEIPSVFHIGFQYEGVFVE